MIRLSVTVAAFAIALVAMPVKAMAQSGEAAKAPALPGGSSSLQETFEGWTLQCAATAGGRLCNVQQQQRHRDSKQLVVAVELTVAPGNAVAGVLVLPFGLKLAAGAALQIDDKPVAPALPFATCLPVGCLVPLNFDRAMINRLRAGNVLKVTAAANEDGKPVALDVSLKGLPAALDRLAGLSQPVPLPK
jgi:invasion protein IalB